MILSLFLVFAGALLMDQISKTQVQKTLLLSESPVGDIRVYRGTFVQIGSLGEKITPEGAIPAYFGLRFQYSRNPGAAFSMLADMEDKYRIPFFYTVTFVAVGMILYLLSTLTYQQHFTRVGLAFIGAGAIGNFLDRIFYGYVVDFIDVDWNLFGWYHDFAIFNVADMCINIGIYLYIIDIIRSWLKDRKSKKMALSQENFANDSAPVK